MERSLADFSASLARVSGVPRVPISPAVRSRIPVLYPRCAIFRSVPPQVSSTSSGCAAIANRSRCICPPAYGDCRVGQTVLFVVCKVHRRRKMTGKNACPTGMCYFFSVEDYGIRQKVGGVVARARCACHWVGEAPGTCGGIAPGGGGRGRHHPPSFFSRGSGKRGW